MDERDRVFQEHFRRIWKARTGKEWVEIDREKEDPEVVAFIDVFQKEVREICEQELLRRQT